MTAAVLTIDLGTPLHQDRTRIVEALLAGAVPPRPDEVAALVDRALQAAERRASVGPTSAAKRTERVRHGIHSAVLTAMLSDGSGPLLDNLHRMSPGEVQEELREWIELKTPEHFGLWFVPSTMLLRSVLKDIGVTAGRSRQRRR